MVFFRMGRIGHNQIIRSVFPYSAEEKALKILLVDDDYEISKALRLVLERNKYTVDTVYNGDDALDYIRSGTYDGVILDIMIPGKDGLEVLRTMRAAGDTTPVLLLSARGELHDRVTGLEIGADDYLPKPFAVPELLARVRAMLRRTGSYTGDILHIGNVTLSCTTYELSSKHGSFRLNNKEFQLMEHFMRNPGVVYSSDDLMEKFWGWDSEAEINVVWTNIGYLRRKLRELQATAEIRSIRGVGYCLEEKPC